MGTAFDQHYDRVLRFLFSVCLAGTLERVILRPLSFRAVRVWGCEPAANRLTLPRQVTRRTYFGQMT